MQKRRVWGAAITTGVGCLMLLGSFELGTLTAQTEAVVLERLGLQAAFSRTVVVRSGRTRTVYVSGQVGRGEDLATQMLAAYENLVTRLKEAGVGPEALVQTRAFVVNYRPEDFKLWQDTVVKVLPSSALPAATLVGVQALATPRLLFEVEGVAVAED
jgi:enamine deaminase RidA (YjgF/YER057c/UK114 family)